MGGHGASREHERRRLVAAGAVAGACAREMIHGYHGAALVCAVVVIWARRRTLALLAAAAFLVLIYPYSFELPLELAYLMTSGTG